MGWSIGEVRSLCIKAAKGAGFSWGLAEEAGFAAEWLEVRSAPGLEALARYLHGVDHIAMPSSGECPISTGAAMSDAGSWKGYSTGKLAQPILLVPFLSSLCANEGLHLHLTDGEILVSGTSLKLSGNFDLSTSKPVEYKISEAKITVPESSCVSRVSQDRKQWIDELTSFAARTYAPATEQSRLSGAGAGTNDND